MPNINCFPPATLLLGIYSEALGGTANGRYLKSVRILLSSLANDWVKEDADAL